MDKTPEPFEQYPALASWIERLGNSGLNISLGDWMVFIGALNQALIAAARPAVVSDEVVSALEFICNGPRDADMSYRELFMEDCERARAALALLPGGVVPDREAIARVIDPRVWELEDEGAFKGYAQQAARVKASLRKADAIIAMLSASPKGTSQSQPSRTTQEPPSPTPCDLEGE